jgi:hypothetical protein
MQDIAGATFWFADTNFDEKFEKKVFGEMARTNQPNDGNKNSRSNFRKSKRRASFEIIVTSKKC